MARNIRISSLSRFVATPLYQLKDSLGISVDSYGFGVWNRIDIADRADDIVHQVQQQELGRLDLVANKYYADPLLWWVIADKNAILDPLTDMTTGQELRIPPLSSVRAAIETAAGRRGR